LKRLGSQATIRPPEVPIEFTAAETHDGRKKCKKSLAFWSVVRVSWRSKMSGLVLSKSLLKEADLRGPPNPLMFKERINYVLIVDFFFFLIRIFVVSKDFLISVNSS
jgi:hypothetical protein